MEGNGGVCSSFAFLCKFLVSVCEYRMLLWAWLEGPPLLNLLPEFALTFHVSVMHALLISNSIR